LQEKKQKRLNIGCDCVIMPKVTRPANI